MSRARDHSTYLLFRESTKHSGDSPRTPSKLKPSQQNSRSQQILAIQVMEMLESMAVVVSGGV